MSVPSASRHAVPRVLFRFLSGRSLDGRARTNSTFLRRADKILTPHGRASRWAHLPGWHRAAWRISGTVALALFLYGYTHARTITLAATFSLLALSAILGVWLLIRLVRLWKHRRHIVTPIYQTLAAITGHAPSDNPERHLSIPLNYADSPAAKVRLSLPPVWEGSLTQQKALSGMMSRRLGGDWEAHFYHHARPVPHVEFVRAPAPPAKVSFSDIREAFDSGNANRLILGIGSRSQIVSVSLDSDSPHIALSIGTGGGKSTMIRAIIAYLRKHGVERIDVIDPKRVSQNWARGIPGVYIWRNITAQMEAIHNVRLRMESRYDALDSDDNLTFARHVLIIEEQNSFIDYARQYWEDYRRELEPSERARTPKRNPAISDLSFILYQGRQGNINVISVLQRQSATASGGGDLRSQYGAKLLARWDRPTWRMLMGTPYIAPSRVNGRALFVIGDEQRAMQMPYLSEQEAREYALSGPAPVLPARVSDSRISQEPSGESNGLPAPADDLMSLREIAESGIVPVSYAALRKARSRDSEFPGGVRQGHMTLYRPEDLRTWQANRLRQVRS